MALRSIREREGKELFEAERVRKLFDFPEALFLLQGLEYKLVSCCRGGKIKRWVNPRANALHSIQCLMERSCSPSSQSGAHKLELLSLLTSLEPGVERKAGPIPASSTREKITAARPKRKELEPDSSSAPAKSG